jgi:3-oxoacyl-(acyl-carrier-protein) synthase
MAGYRQLFVKLMEQRRPKETARLLSLPARDKELAAEGGTLFDEEVENQVSRLTGLEMEAARLAVREAGGRPPAEVEQARLQAMMASGAENCEALNATIEWEAEAKARALQQGLLSPEDLERRPPSAA